MTNGHDSLERVRKRIAEVEFALQALTQELDELRVAEKVLTRLDQAPPLQERSAEETNVPRDTPNSETGSKRAPLPQQVLEVLKARGPLESRALHAQLVDQRPGLTLPTLLSTLSRMKAGGQVLHRDRLWKAGSR